MNFDYDNGVDRLSQHGNLKRIVATWVSDSGGGASGTTEKIVGRIIKVQTVPGSPAPSDGYSVTVSDSNGINVLAACDAAVTGSDSVAQEKYLFVLDHANTPTAQPVHPAVCDVLTVTIADAGSAKAGTMIVHYQPL
jgi:hypothetical protein